MKKSAKKLFALIQRVPFITGLLVLMCAAFVVYAVTETAEYTTVGGTWVQENDRIWTMDKDGDGKADIILTKDGKEWTYRFTVQDPDAAYYAWETIPEGLSEEEAKEYVLKDGKGDRANPVTNVPIKVSHTPNVSDDGVPSGNCPKYHTMNEVIQIEGAEKLNVTITYGSQSVSSAWVCMWKGNHPDYSANLNYKSSVTDRLGGGSYTSSANTKTYEVEGDTVTFGFRSSGSEGGYGYYAVVEGIGINTDFSITNEAQKNIDYGSLKLTKQVVDGDPDKNFRFDIALTGDEDTSKYLEGTQTFGELVFKDGKSTVYLKDGDSVSVTGLPAGIHYAVTESENDGYDVSWEGNASGTMEKDTEVLLTCKNTKKAEPVKPQPEQGKVTVKKTVVNGSSDDTFLFRMALWDLDPETSYSYSGSVTGTFTADTNGMANVSFGLKDKEEVQFTSLPAGCRYQVMEEANLYTASYKIEGASVTAMDQQSNTEAEQDLSTARETVYKEETAVVHFTNQKEEGSAETLDIPVEKVWVDRDSASRPEYITVYLLQGEDIIASVRLDEDSDWKGVFEDLSRYEADGATECTYSVQEVKVPGYTSKIVKQADGTYVITNTESDIGSLRIKKAVEGGGEKDKDFLFKAVLTKEGKPVSGTYQFDETAGTKTGSIVFDENGEAAFTLKHGESIAIKSLPAGAECSVTETAYKNYTTNENGIFRCRIPKQDTAQIDIVNTYYPTTTLSVKKTVEGSMGSKIKSFSFELVLTGDNLPSSLPYTKGTKADAVLLNEKHAAAFTLKHGEKITFEVPVGVSYEVNELNTGAYEVAYTNQSGTTSEDEVSVNVTNTRNSIIPTSADTNTKILFVLTLSATAGLVLFCFRKMKR